MSRLVQHICRLYETRIRIRIRIKVVGSKVNELHRLEPHHSAITKKRIQNITNMKSFAYALDVSVYTVIYNSKKRAYRKIENLGH